MTDKKSVLVDVNYLVQKVEQLIQTPQVQELMYLQSILKQNEEAVVPKKGDKKEADKE